MESLIHSLFALSPAVRYVALLRGKELELQERPGLSGASASETDRYEELLARSPGRAGLRRPGPRVESATATSGPACSPPPTGTSTSGSSRTRFPPSTSTGIRAELARGRR